ncbi:MAG: YgiQ family radical SAM protein [Deltaproteobacteria bacterium]|nr:YgiQ family radical SAM protein [Deltaproteobacteria bacterium]
MSAAEMRSLGWDRCDVVLVTGDAYVDHPSFGAALIGRVLEAHGFRVGVIAQPDWTRPDDFARLGAPELFFAVSSGNMDSMVNRYTAERRRRSDDAYSPGAEPDRRPDRAVIVYANRCRQACPGVPVVIGGLEASLRRLAHYDYWSDKLRRSVLLDAKADLLLFGNAERAVVELAQRLAAGEATAGIRDLRGSAFARPHGAAEPGAMRLPDFEDLGRAPQAHARAVRELYAQARPESGRSLVQRHGDRDVVVRPPPLPLSTRELDRVYELPYSRRPHPAYGKARIPAYEMIRFSVTVLRGCYGGCSFCSLACHEGPVIQSRSERSVLAEIARIRDGVPGFSGIVSDLGGPTANMYRTGCRRPGGAGACRRLSCLYPEICEHLDASPAPLIRLYRKARAVEGVDKVLVASGVRMDLAVRSADYVRELAQHHVGGQLKVAPEHICRTPLAHMQKPGLEVFERFRALFERYSAQAGLEQYLIPYLIAAHPGTRDEDMLELACWLKSNRIRVDQVQTFLPSPLTLATAMYCTGLNPLRPQKGGFQPVFVPRGERQRRLHKALLRYHDPENWPLLRKALRAMGRADLIGGGAQHLVPASRARAKRKRGKEPGK